jgi:fatty acid amide hydrolase
MATVSAPGSSTPAQPKQEENAITRLSAVELAARIASSSLSSVEVVEAHIEQIERVNTALNAVVLKRYERAREEARIADARRSAGGPLPPLLGVPVTLKESLDLEGTPSTFGLPSRAAQPSPKDDLYVGRLREAGAIVLGKTNVSQLLLFIESDNPVYGRTNNPWNLERSPGGSSGGQAAIIAAGGSPLGLATDIGGSIRVPAALCGIAGFKATSGRLPDPGRFSSPIGQRAVVSQVGVLARDIEDVALALGILNEGRNPDCELPIPLSDPRTVVLSRLKVGFYTEDGTLKPAPAVARAVREAAIVLEGMGAHVTEWSPPDAARALDLFLGILSADGGRCAKRSLGGDKRDRRIAVLEKISSMPKPLVSAVALALKLSGRRRMSALMKNFGYRDADHFFQLVEAQMDYQERFRAALDSDPAGPFDLVLCPACALPAFRHGASEELLVAGAYACLYNLLGYPTGVVPFTRVRSGEEIGRQPSSDPMEQKAYLAEKGSAGLPIGVQVVARPWREHVALAAMSAIQAAARIRPDYPSLP